MERHERADTVPGWRVVRQMPDPGKPLVRYRLHYMVRADAWPKPYSFRTEAYGTDAEHAQAMAEAYIAAQPVPLRILNHMSTERVPDQPVWGTPS